MSAEPDNKGAVRAIVRLRCPECKKGIVYSHKWTMNRLCPNCGIEFEREDGYFTGAIWISIIIASPLMLGFMFLFIYFFRDLHPALAGFLSSLVFIPLVPITIRLSRALWMYFDHQMHPQMPSDDRGGTIVRKTDVPLSKPPSGEREPDALNVH
jgi:uncharacterized protein (DUF983 family)